MNPDHFGLVIGLSRYSALGTPPPANLNGPENDAAAMSAWLVDPAGGGLPPANVRTLVSSDYEQRQPGQQQPWRDKLEDDAFLWINMLAQQNVAGRTVGKRLYVHVSGHGFSPASNQGCLVAANASADRRTANVNISGWLQWWQDAGYFREFVVTMDCCMDRMPSGMATEIPLGPINAGGAPGPAFVAFAAQRGLRAVERQIPEANGKIYGIFTWCLLQGLRGGARDTAGRVTGPSLGRWLRAAVRPWLEAGDAADPEVSKLPHVVAEDPALTLCRPAEPLLLDLTLRFDPSCAGAPGRLWSGTPPQPTAFAVGMDGTARLHLPAGLHAAEVAAAGTVWRQAFAVTRAADVAVTEQGEAVDASAVDHPIRLDPGDPAAAITVVDAAFNVVEAPGPRLDTHLPFGLYAVAVQAGRQVRDSVVLLDRPWPVAGRPEAQGPALPRFTSAAPLGGTAAAHEYHESAAFGSAPDLVVGAGAELLVMARSFTPDGARSPVREPWAGVRLLRADGGTVADLAVAGRRDTDTPDPWAACLLRLDPGSYRLRFRDLGGAELERGLVLPPAADGGAPWRLEAYLLSRSAGAGTPVQSASSLLMRRGDRQGSLSLAEADRDLVLEKARVALTDGRPILTRELAAVLLAQDMTPLSGIIGGHLALLGAERGIQPVADLNGLVPRLRALAGHDHPDIEALSLRCDDPALRRQAPFTAPPMLEQSWRLMVAASRDAPGLVPEALWRTVHAAVSAPPFLAWAADQAVQAAYLRDLRGVLLDPPRAAAGPVADILARTTWLAPAQAPDALWSMAQPFSLGGDIGRPAHLPALDMPSEATVRARAEALGLPPAALATLIWTGPTSQ